MQGLKLRETNIQQIVHESLNSVDKPDSVILSTAYDIDDPIVWLDHERIVKALIDLETNAIDAMPNGGELSVMVGGNQEQVSITLRDTGCGISGKDMDHLFTPFFTTKPVGEGTGLGLPSAYGLIKAHGGALTIESNADPANGPTGTTIQIALPRRSLLKDTAKKWILHEE